MPLPLARRQTAFRIVRLVAESALEKGVPPHRPYCYWTESTHAREVEVTHCFKDLDTGRLWTFANGSAPAIDDYDDVQEV